MQAIRRTLVAGLVLAAGLFAGTAAGPAVAAGTAPAGKPVSLISYNVCGASSTCKSSAADEDVWADEALQKVSDLGATDVVMLQELCAGQYEKLMQKLGVGYSGYFEAKLSSPGCDQWSTTATPTAESTQLGQAVILRTSAGVVGSSVQVVANDTRLAVCAKGPVAGRHTLACSVHLSASTAAGDMHELFGHIEAKAGGAAVILGGDFNARPDVVDPTVGPGRPVTGPLVEADAGTKTPTAGWNTTTKTYTAKFDHAFFSSEDFATPSASVADVQLAGTKDHALLRAKAVTRAPVDGDLTGDGRPDLLAVRKDGTLRLYPGIGAGRFGSPQLIGSGGWLGAVVSHRGDWTGDGREDVVARIGDNLWIYPNVGGGTLGERVAVPNRETGWTGTVPLAAGDLDGDGQCDLIVKSASGSSLWLHRGGTPATGPSLPRAAIGLLPTEGDWADHDVLTPGDVTENPAETGDENMADLWVRNRTTGELKEFRSKGAAGLAAPQTIGGDMWTAAQRPLAVSLGNADADGRADLWVTTKYDATTATGGDLWFRSGTTGTFGTPVRVGEGGWAYIESLA
ncbi:FG-GAP-like repeat-containing protein [Streptomyces sp. NPDC058613]|uniref:FG-GAP-like repeat-containing protein n=1 Tax=Streptomyces sp. NPDC058613 TaxID=3346556 RepID=UPI0036564AC8